MEGKTLFIVVLEKIKYFGINLRNVQDQYEEYCRISEEHRDLQTCHGHGAVDSIS